MAGIKGDLPSTLEFALSVLSTLSRSEPKSAKQIKEEIESEFGIVKNLRSVQRMLKDLRQIYAVNIEVIDNTKPFSFKWDKNAPRSLIPGMTELELLVLDLTKRFLRPVVPDHLGKRRNDLLSVLPIQDQIHAKDLQEWKSKVYIVAPTQPLIPPEIDEKTLRDVQDSVMKGLKLRVHYRNQADRESQMLVSPAGIIDRQPFVYTIGFLSPSGTEYSINKNRSQVRALILSRMLSTSVTDEPVEIPRHFNLNEYVQEGRYLYGHGQQVELSFEIKKKAGNHIREAKLSEDQTCEEVDSKYYRFTATVFADLSIYTWVYGFGDQIRNIKGLPPFEELFS